MASLVWSGPDAARIRIGGDWPGDPVETARVLVRRYGLEPTGETDGVYVALRRSENSQMPAGGLTCERCRMNA